MAAITIDLGRLAQVSGMELLDVTGRIARSIGVNASRHTVMGLQGVAPGEYVLRVAHAGGYAMQRVVVQ